MIVDAVNEFTARDIIRYEIKEDCFFDKQRSVMDRRIIGISPVIYYTDPETGDIMGLKNLFWLYFPECRYIFQNHKVYNSHNDAMSMSFDDLFWKREFSSLLCCAWLASFCPFEIEVEKQGFERLGTQQVKSFRDLS